MIKLFVAEDQLLIQKDLCRKIGKTGKNVEIAGTAMNGQEAFEKILKLRPDILVTDIRMPIVTGLELIRRLNENHISMKTVILSGYRDFEYAKEALTLGVDEYLLKPVSAEDLKFVLDTLEEEICSQQNFQFQQAVYSALHAGAPVSRPLSDARRFTSCHLMLINLDSYTVFSFQDWLPCENELDELLKGPVVKKYLKKDESVSICDGQTYNQKILVFLLNSTSPEKLDRMASELQARLTALTATATICISRPFSSLDSLGAEYKLLNTQLENQLVFGYSEILHSHNFLDVLKQPSASLLLDDSWLEAFRMHILSANLEAFLNSLSTFLSSCHKNRITQKQLSFTLKKLLHLFSDPAGSESLNGSELEIDEYLSNAKSYEELRISLSLMFEQLFRKKRYGNAATPQQLVEDVKQYIRIHYGKDININDIAVHFGITPTYLSRLFKKYAGVRPIEYLTNYRIMQACDYFSHSQLTVREVADLCGYSNQFYFSKAFKQITSVSPSEYRIQHQES